MTQHGDPSTQGGTAVDETGHRENSELPRNVTEHVPDQPAQSELIIRDRVASLATLAAGVAHEINTPLATVMSNLDLIAKSLRLRSSVPSGLVAATWLHDEISAPLEDAREGARQVRFVIDDLKIFAGSPTVDRAAKVDLRAIMESSLRMVGIAVYQKATLIKSYVETPPVIGNEGRFGQVFMNLLVNAAQALPVGDAGQNEIRVTTALKGQNVVVEVSDNGPGISPDIITRIFDPFFTTKAVGLGAGLGLAISHRLIADMGGALTVESELGKGATFRVTMPLAKTETSTAPGPPVPAVQSPLRGRILIVDDDELMLRVLKRVLGREHDVVTALEGAEALALCTSGSVFDVIFCDLMMPVMSGAQFYRELARSLPAVAEKIVFLTGGASTESGRAFLEATPNEFLSKPFDNDVVRALIQRRLEGGSGGIGD